MTDDSEINSTEQGDYSAKTVPSAINMSESESVCTKLESSSSSSETQRQPAEDNESPAARSENSRGFEPEGRTSSRRS